MEMHLWSIIEKKNTELSLNWITELVLSVDLQYSAMLMDQCKEMVKGSNSQFIDPEGKEM